MSRARNDPVTVLADEAHRMVLVPALAAEVHRVEPLLGLPGKELLPVDGDRAAAWCARASRTRGRARDELVQLEREEAARAAPCGCEPCARFSGTLETRSRSRSAVRQACSSRPASSLESAATASVDGQRARAHPTLIDFGPRDAEARLDPDRERMLPQARRR